MPIEYPDPILVLAVALVARAVIWTAVFVRRRRDKMVFAVSQAAVRRQARRNQEERARLRAGAPTVFAKLASAFFEVDPAGVNYETNLDEYDSQVATVLPRLTFARSEGDVAQILREEFDDSFDGSYDTRRLDQLAERTWAIWVSTSDDDRLILADAD